MLGTSKSVWGFDPRSIPGCSLWLDAADSTTVTGTTSVTQWRDKSGNGRNTTTTGTISYANSGISITSSSSYLTGSFGSPDYTGTTVTCFIVASMNSASGSVARILGLGKVGTQDWDNLASITLGRGGGLLVRPYRTVPTSSPPSIPAYDTRFIATWGQTSSLLFNSINGGALSTASLSGAFVINAYRIGNDLLSDDVNEQFNGTINEIVVYFSELTTSQRQQIEGYLAHKWGLAGYYDSSIPLTIPGCQLWLDGRDTSSMTFSGSTITQWNDKSGNGYNATIAPDRVGAIYSTDYNAVNFASSTTGYITNYSAAPTNETMFVVGNNPSPSSPNNIIIGGVSGARSLGLGYTNAGTGTIGNLNTQVVWLASVGGYTAGTTALVRSQFTPSSNSVSFNGGSTATGGAPGFTAGRVTYLGVDATNGYFHYNGYMMEALFYNRILTTTEIQTIEGYLAKKWGIGPSSMIPSTHPFSSIRPHLRVFQPIDIPGCQLWLDAADSSVVTTATGVSQWSDKSGNAYNLTQSTGGIQPSYSSSLITFESNKYLNIPASVMNNLPTWSVFFVINPISSSNWIIAKQKDGVDTYNVLSMTINTATSGAIQTGSTGFLYWRSMNAGTQAVSTAAITTSTIQVINLTYDGTNLYFYKNGILEKTTAGAFAIQNDTSPSTYTLGVSIYPGGQILNPGVTNFRLGEMLVYNTAITTAQRQQVEGYLAHKWGLTPSYSTTLPLTIPGCGMWLDGNDPAGTGVKPSDGATVSTWVDKSGNANNGTSGASTFQTDSLGGYINFTGGGSETYGITNTNIVINQYFTVFVVEQLQSAGSRDFGLIGGNGQSVNNNLTILYRGTGTMVFGQYGNDIYSSVAAFTTNATQPTRIWTFSFIPNAKSTYLNGALLDTLVNNSFIQSWGGARIGWYNDTGRLYVGKMREILMYSGTFTANQRQQIEGYLGRKWGIESFSIPSTHPFKLFPPATVFFSYSLITDNLIVSLDPITYVASSTSWQTVGNTWTLASPATIVPTTKSVALSLTAGQSISDNTGISTGPASTNNFTIEIWFNAPGNSTNNLITEVNGGWNTTMMYLENNTIRAAFWNGGTYSFSMGSYAANTWTQACYTYSGTTVRCYTNGVFVSTDTTTKQYPESRFASYRLSTTGWPIYSNTATIIGGFRIYSTALSAADVKMNYNAYASRFGLTAV